MATHRPFWIFLLLIYIFFFLRGLIVLTTTNVFNPRQDGPSEGTTLPRLNRHSTSPTLLITCRTTTSGLSPASRSAWYQSPTPPLRCPFLKHFSPCTSTSPSTSTRSVPGLWSYVVVNDQFLTPASDSLVSGTSVSGTSPRYKSKAFLSLICLCLFIYFGPFPSATGCTSSAVRLSRENAGRDNGRLNGLG